MLKSLFSFLHVPTAEKIARRQLEEARRKLLDAQTSKEYAESMIRYYDSQVRRLTIYLKDFE